jgi:ATP-dependent Clp protease ATP-binding subunit ClpA
LSNQNNDFSALIQKLKDNKIFTITSFSDLVILFQFIYAELSKLLEEKKKAKKYLKTLKKQDGFYNSSTREKNNMISKELELTLKFAYKDAKKRRHEYITLEHILYALTFDKTASEILKHCGANIETLKKEIEKFLEDAIPAVSKEYKNVDPLHTLSVQRVLQFAAIHIQSSGKEEISSADILVSMFREKESHALYFLSQQNITKLDIIKFISHGISKVNPEEDGVLQDGESDDKKKKNALEAYCINLNKRASEGKIDPLIGRDKELERMIHVLARRRKNNPILVGDSGVGKTAVVEGLALRIIEKKVPKALETALVSHSPSIWVLY